MKFRNVTREQLEQALYTTSIIHYPDPSPENYGGGGNLIWKRAPTRKGNAFIATLRVKDSHKAGARLSAQGKHTVAASWHAHRDFFRTLLTVAPECIIDTGLYGAQRYAGLEDFEQKHPATYFINIGSEACHVRIGELSVL
jgi:hypothetical protein